MLGVILRTSTIEPTQPIKACIIWMHGLGASGMDMHGLASQWPGMPQVRHIFLDAPIRPVTINGSMPMRAWYDIVGVKLNDREDKTGISSSASIITEACNQQINSGLDPQSIYLAGFSQGAAMALYTGLHMPRLGGIIALSGYLPLVHELKPSLDNKTPIWMAAGSFDQIVLPLWTQISVEHLKRLNYENVMLKNYSMGHEVCLPEIYDLVGWFKNTIKD